MEQQIKSDVIVIDDDPCPESTEDSLNDKNGLEIQEDLVTLYNKLFPEPVVDLSDRISVKDKKGTACSNVRCKTADNELVTPSQSALSYFNLPSKSLLICKTCCAVADEFMRDMLDKYYKGESLFDCSFPPINPVVVIDSDGEEDSDKRIKPDISEENSAILEETVTALVKKHISVYSLDQQIENGKRKLDETVQRLEAGYGNLIEEVQAASNDLFKCMQTLYETFAPKTEMLEPLDIPFEEMRPSVLFSRQKEKKTSQEVNVGTVAVKIPGILPQFGPLMRPKPQPGQKFYVIRGQHFSDWVPAIVLSALDKSDHRPNSGEFYRVRMECRTGTGSASKLQTIEKDVSDHYMAYFNYPTVRLTLGTRIIAHFNNYTPHPSKFFPGVVAEPPSPTNKYRYLIFFDDGYAQYVRHVDTRLVVRSKPIVSDYFTTASQRFIREYFKTYPERPMLKINVLECVKVMRKGAWHNCRVVEVDASLIRVLFLMENYAEWVYRGSTRLRPLFDHATKLKTDFRKRTGGNAKGPYISYDLVSTSSDSDPEYPITTESQITTNEEQPDRQKRAVAKKSTNRLPDFIEPPSPPLPVRRNVKRMTRQQYGKIETLIPSNCNQPKPYKKHICGPHCILPVQYDERKMKSINPLIVPCLFGFRRDSDMNLIFYCAPCGKKLKSMEDVLYYTVETNIRIGLDHFDFDPSVNIYNEFIVPPQHVLIKDLSHGRENVPIPVVNSINATIPDMMEYMTERRGLEGVFLNLDENFLIGCDCTDNCMDRSKCSCHQMTINEAKAWSKYFNIEKPEQAGYQNRRLPIGLPSGIWECNKKCKCCTKTCLNRVAQYPLKVKLQLFKTKKKGWGVRCINDIPCGTFICVYNGNILTEKNANEGGLRHGDEYFAELDYIECMEVTKTNYEPTAFVDENETDAAPPPTVKSTEEQGSNVTNRQTRRKKFLRRKSNTRSSDSATSSDSDEAVRQPQSFAVDDDDDDDDDDSLPFPSVRQLFGRNEAVYVMDAKTAGNIGRYFNHACDPNVHVQSVFVDTHDLRFPWIAFFSQKYIRAGTELTWDYRYEPGKVPGKRLLCYCGAANCRKRLL